MREIVRRAVIRDNHFPLIRPSLIEQAAEHVFDRWRRIPTGNDQTPLSYTHPRPQATDLTIQFLLLLDVA